MLFGNSLLVNPIKLLKSLYPNVQPSGEEEEDVATSPRKKKPAAGGGRASDGDEVETIQAQSFGYYAFSSTSGSAPMICRHIDEGVVWGFS